MDWRYAVKSSNVDGKELRGNGFPLGCADKYFAAQMITGCYIFYHVL